MKKIKITYTFLIIVTVILCSFLFFEVINENNQSYNQQVKPAEENALYDSNGRKLLVLETPTKEEEISSPLIVKGEAVGNWFFEADFPVILTNWDGLIIAQGIARAQGDWMTENLVPFEAELEFQTPDYGDTGSLILKKDNPSDLPEFDNAYEITIRFKK